MKIPAILKQALSEISPNKEDHWVVKDVNAFLNRLKLELKSRKINAKPILGGSFAKDTWLKGDYDVDVFVAFDMKHKDDALSDLLAKALKPWKTERVHGSRDYFQIHGKINYEIIPVLAIKTAKQAQNVTDFSPKHVAWVNTKGKKFKGDIRLFKKFCKAQRMYGAESYIRGYSGHVVDILVIYFKGFLPLLKAASKWDAKAKIVLDYNNSFKGQALFKLNESKIQGPLVVVDPVQPDRNAAAALVQEHFEALIHAAKDFLKKPSIDFFIEETESDADLKKQGALIMHATTIKEKEDIAGVKMVKAFQYITQQLIDNDFTVMSDWQWDKKSHAVYWFRTKEKTLPATMLRRGPPTDIPKAVAIFKKKYKTTKTVKGRLVANVKREFRTPLEVIKHAMKSDYLKDKLVALKLA